MIKKFFILALLAIIATGAFALDISMAAGGGLLFDWSFNNGVEFNTGGQKGSFSMEILSFGGFGFFDATYAELDVSFAYGSLTGHTEYPGAKKTQDIGSALQLGFTLLGKYPIYMGDFTVFPLLGVGYNMWLSAKDENNRAWDHPGDNSQFGILAGAGLDFPLPFSDALFLRAEALLNLRFASKEINDAAKSSSGDTTLGLGPRIKIGVGYMF